MGYGMAEHLAALDQPAARRSLAPVPRLVASILPGPGRIFGRRVCWATPLDIESCAAPAPQHRVSDSFRSGKLDQSLTANPQDSREFPLDEGGVRTHPVDKFEGVWGGYGSIAGRRKGAVARR